MAIYFAGSAFIFPPYSRSPSLSHGETPPARDAIGVRVRSPAGDRVAASRILPDPTDLVLWGCPIRQFRFFSPPGRTGAWEGLFDSNSMTRAPLPRHGRSLTTPSSILLGNGAREPEDATPPSDPIRIESPPIRRGFVPLALVWDPDAGAGQRSLARVPGLGSLCFKVGSPRDRVEHSQLLASHASHWLGSTQMTLPNRATPRQAC